MPTIPPNPAPTPPLTNSIPTGTMVKGKIPRPPNSWIIYRREQNDILQEWLEEEGEPALAAAEVSKLVSLLWKALSAEERADYGRQAVEEKAIHKQTYPDYKFQPQKKKTKKAKREATASPPPSLNATQAASSSTGVQPKKARKGKAAASPLLDATQPPSSSTGVVGPSRRAPHQWGANKVAPYPSSQSTPLVNASVPLSYQFMNYSPPTIDFSAVVFPTIPNAPTLSDHRSAVAVLNKNASYMAAEPFPLFNPRVEPQTIKVPNHSYLSQPPSYVMPVTTDEIDVEFGVPPPLPSWVNSAMAMFAAPLPSTARDSSNVGHGSDIVLDLDLIWTVPNEFEQFAAAEGFKNQIPFNYGVGSSTGFLG